jgi:hypothetical protein
MIAVFCGCCAGGGQVVFQVGFIRALRKRCPNCSFYLFETGRVNQAQRSRSRNTAGEAGLSIPWKLPEAYATGSLDYARDDGKARAEVPRE